MSVKLVYFSPAGSTKRIVQLLGSAWNTAEEIDVTPYSAKDGQFEFAKDDFAIFGVPSFGGRVPTPAAERFSRIKGNDTPAVVVSVFGNRAYDDTLRELAAILEKQGFRVIAAVAAVAEHSIARKYGAGRPDADDIAELKSYAQRIKALSECAAAPCVLFGNTAPYREYSSLPIKPHAGKKCNGCGVCAAHCPADAIPHDHPDQTDDKKCISCMGCVSVCPAGARSLNKIMLFGAEKMLKKLCETPKKNELILG